MTAENVRYHAAGHLAAVLMIAHRYPEAAKEIIRVVGEYAKRPTVAAPPAITEILERAEQDPHAHAQELTLLETWFVDPFNTVIENSGAKF